MKVRPYFVSFAVTALIGLVILPGSLAKEAVAAVHSCSYYFGRAKEHYKRSQYAAAENDLTELLDIFPNTQSALELRTNALAQEGKCAAALDDLIEQIYRQRGVANLTNRALAKAAFKSFPSAARDWDKKAASAKADAKVLFGKSLWSFLNGEIGTACSAASEAIKLRPDFQPAFIMRAYSLLALRKMDQADRDVKKAIALAPKDERSYRVLVDYYYEAGAQEKAVKAIDERLQREHDQEIVALLYCARGDVYNAVDQPQKAIVDYTKAIAARPSWAKPYRLRGTIYRIEDEPEKAASDLAVAVKQDPHDARAFAERATLYFEEQKFALAEKDLTAVIALKYNIAKSYLARAGCYEKMHRPDLAAADRKISRELLK